MAARNERRPVAPGALLLAACGAALAVTGSPARAATACPWMNPALRPAARAAMLLLAMSPSDKLAMLSGVDASFEPYEGAGDGYSGFVPANPRLCIPPLTLNDGPAGVAHGLAGTTAFPAPIAQAATWNSPLQRAFGMAAGREAWQKGIDVLLAPNVNIARVPENGRNFEAFGEDPFLSAQTAIAEIQGIQRNPVIATVKHFAVNSQETSRYWLRSVVDDRTLHEIYFPPFEAAVRQGHVGAVMCAYGVLNGPYNCESPLLTTVLKQEFAFDGIVMSDWGATHSTVAAAGAGLDLEMPTGVNFGAPLADALAAGTVTAARVDGMTRDVLTSMFRLGLFDQPPPPRATAFTTDVSTPGHDAVARKLAEESTVLLKNAKRSLPLHLTRGATIAVIGAPALGDITPFTSGGGSAYIAATNAVTPLAAITARAARTGDNVVSADGSDQAAAAALAGSASVAIVFAYDQEREGQDRPGLDLSGAQDQLIEQVAEANPNTVVVLDTGGPVLMPWLKQVPAVLEAWYPGQADGDAIAAILFGDVDPSGKLPQTFPTSNSALPASTPSQWPGANDAQDAIFSEGIDVGYRWYDRNKVEPLFPFGHGLSYTRFTYRHLRVRRRATSVRVSFSVENTGARAGKEVSQLYVDDPRIDGEPPRQLKGYRKFFLRPRHSARVTLVLPLRAFAHWDSAAQVWAVSPGLYRILVGSSSRDIRLHGFVRQRARGLGA